MQLFISFEGGECTGKTTQSELLRDRLLELGHRCVLVHEPGGTALGDRLRGFIKGELPITYEAELFLFSAARTELVSKVIKPSLDKGIIVITDRYVDSTTAYQGYGRRLDLGCIESINSLSTQGILPDLTILLDMPPDDALKRLASLQMELSLGVDSQTPQGRVDHQGQRKFEEETLDFHRRVRKGYLALAKDDTHRWMVVDASQPSEVVSKAIRERVEAMISGVGSPTRSSDAGPA
ncbi:MAG: dTMP kinase [Chloroflexi bacterium]|nr:dTMP kinase [Chloroflexota bacterium]